MADIMQENKMMTSTDHKETPVPVLRVKRHRGWAPDAVHVQVRKRRRLTNALDSLTISDDTQKELGQSQTTSNGHNAEYVVFRRVNLTNEAAKRALGSESAVHMVDVDDAYLVRKDAERTAKPNTAMGAMNGVENRYSDKASVEIKGLLKEEENDVNMEKLGMEEQQDILFAPDDNTAGERVPQAWRDGMTEEVNDVAIVQPGHISQLDELVADFIHEDKLNGTGDTSDECGHDDDSDYDAHTVDYPSTPEGGASGLIDGDDDSENEDDYTDNDIDNVGIERGEWDRQLRWMDKDENISSDGGDYERYERFAEAVEYDSEC